MHPYIPELEKLYRQKRISRREFLRNACLLGLSFAAANAFVVKTAHAEDIRETGIERALRMYQEQPQRGGTLRMFGRVMRIDHPARYSWVHPANQTRHVAEYLTLTDGDNVTHPYLLEKWEASEDLKTWTLYLRQGVKWNNGDDFVADDVVFTMKDWLDPEVGSSILGLMSYLKPEGIEKVDDYTVKLHLDSAQIAVPEHLFHYPALVMNYRTFEGDFLKAPVGTGPYTLEEWSEGERAVLKRRTDPPYWQTGADGEPLPYMDGITYIDLGEEVSAPIAGFQAGEIDGMTEIAPVEWYLGLKDDPNAQVLPVTTARTTVLRMRVDREPWTDNQVRMALKLCQNHQKILDLAFYGQGALGQDFHVAPVHPEYCEKPIPEYDPEKAKALLEKAGYPDGLTVKIDVGSGWPEVVSYAEVLKEDAAPAGFNIEINTMPTSAYWDIWTETDLGITPWTHRPLGTMVLSLAYICDEEGQPVPWNETRWCDEEFTALLKEAEGTLDVEERREMMCKLEDIQWERGSIGIPFWRNAWAIMHKKVQNIKAHPTNYDLFNEVWLKEA